MNLSNVNTMVTDELADIDAYRDDKNKPNSCCSCGLPDRKYLIGVVKANPLIFLRSFVAFLILCGIGIFIIILKDNHNRNLIEQEALELAVETGRWFSDQLDQAIIPLFAVGLFVQEMEIFHDLPLQIGPANEPGSLPFLPRKDPEEPLTHRNVTGVCDEPELVATFTRIASTIKAQSNMEKVLVNIQLAPQAVVCLLHPMINTEDFPEGIVMDNSGAWGHDLLTDPARKFIAEATIPSDDVVIAGPLTLRQCQDCDPTVKKAFIARMAIKMKGHEIVVDNVPYEKWGFAVVLINWDALIDRSGIYERFEERGFEFQLTRTDYVQNPSTDELSEKVVVLAETPNFDDDSLQTVYTPLQTTNNEWVMTVGFERDMFPTWKVWSIVATVFSAYFIIFLYILIQIQNINFQSIKRKYVEDIAHPARIRLRQYLAQENQAAHDSKKSHQDKDDAPIADFFPATTILVAEIDEFTAWSSQREPGQVFTLLQHMLRSFNKLAKNSDVYTVETIGDRYVAVSGFPSPQFDHALRMIKFACDCMNVLDDLTRTLERSLGPGTADLRLRIGLHSGPVTAGVIADTNSKLQLFGETLSIAHQIESMGEGGKIHFSQATATVLIEAGQSQFLEARNDKIAIKGKGNVKTYFVNDSCIWHGKKRLDPNSTCTSRTTENELLFYSESNPSDNDDDDLWSGAFHLAVKNDIELDETSRLIEWNVDCLIKLLKQVMAKRNRMTKRKKSKVFSHNSNNEGYIPSNSVVERKNTPLEEVVEVIELPNDRHHYVPKKSEMEAVTIEPEVISQLRSLVKEIASMYNNNPFHNFGHASHATMSVHKLLNRVVVPEQVNYDQSSAKKVAADVHDYTFGMNSDPLIHFGIVFSALVHDVDHSGVSNVQLATEDPLLAEEYNMKSIAEQHSVDIAWDVLMKGKYTELHSCLFADDAELLRFRQIFVNIVLATDIFDKELKELRNLRWDKAFHPERYPEESLEDTRDETYSQISAGSKKSAISSKSTKSRSVVGSGRALMSEDGSVKSLAEKRKGLSSKRRATNRRATIVIEHIMQASDVAHTMQHWSVYCKWNEKLFQEMYLAWLNGRSQKDPSEGWYKGELWFFDNYVIPLARKLSDCGVFGVCSDECFLNAIENRKEWELRGRDVVSQMVERARHLEEEVSKQV